jgi:ABC-type transport system substrate-binding protein
VDDIIWYAHSGTGKLDKQKGGAYGPSNTFHGAELPCDMQALYWANATEVDKDQRIQNNIEMQNYISEWSLQLPFASITDYWMVGPNIKAWSPHKIAGRYFTNPETVQVK